MNKETENRNRIRVAKETWRMVCELECVTEENGEEVDSKVSDRRVVAHFEYEGDAVEEFRKMLKTLVEQGYLVDPPL